MHSRTFYRHLVRATGLGGLAWSLFGLGLGSSLLPSTEKKITRDPDDVHDLFRYLWCVLREVIQQVVVDPVRSRGTGLGLQDGTSWDLSIWRPYCKLQCCQRSIRVLSHHEPWWSGIRALYWAEELSVNAAACSLAISLRLVMEAPSFPFRFCLGGQTFFHIFTTHCSTHAWLGCWCLVVTHTWSTIILFSGRIIVGPVPEFVLRTLLFLS